MDIWYILMELLILFGLAFFLGSLAQRLRQSPILGYIMAGVVAGPLLANAVMVNQAAELGVSLLLFSIGLEFSVKQLKRMGRITFGAGSLQVSSVLVISVLLLVGFTGMSMALVMGAMVALSSTTIVLRSLVDRSEMDSVHGRTSLGILLFQDMAILPLVLMINLMTPGEGDTSFLMDLVTLMGSIAGLVLGLYLILYQLAPRLLGSSQLFANRELTVLFAVSTGLGATWAAHWAGISPALGAFIAGMLLGESPFATQLRADVGSLRTLMVTLFFTSVGMYINPIWFVTHLHWIFPLAILIFLVKMGLIYFIARWFGLTRSHALATGITLAQVGEFAFVLATEARMGGLISMKEMDLILSVVIVLMLATPFMVAWALPMADAVVSALSRSTLDSEDEEDSEGDGGEGRLVVVGLGPAGRNVVQTAKGCGLMPVILDVNPQSREFAREEGVEFHLGDASQEETLVHVGLKKASMMVITVPDPKIAGRIIGVVRQMLPDLIVLVRCRYNRHMNYLSETGATEGVDEESVVGEMLSYKISEYLETDSCTLMACRLCGRQDIPEMETA